LKKTLMDTRADSNARQTALTSLLQARAPGLAPVLQDLLKDSALRGSALRALATVDDANTPAAILEVYPSLNSAEKRDALNTLASRESYAKAMLAAVGKTVLATDITAEMVRQLRNLKSNEIEKLIQKVWGVARDSSADAQANIEKYRAIHRAGGSTPGDA